MTIPCSLKTRRHQQLFLMLFHLKPHVVAAVLKTMDDLIQFNARLSEEEFGHKFVSILTGKLYSYQKQFVATFLVS